jgi:hypothetical protein
MAPPKHEIHGYRYWEAERIRGRSGVKKVRRDTALSKRADGVLEFHYTGYKNRDHELLLTLDEHNVFTISREDRRYYPTYANIFWMFAGLVVYADMAHFKHHAQPIRIHVSGKRWRGRKDCVTLPFTNGLRFHKGECLNPEIVVDLKRTLNREKSLPWLRKTVVLAKVLRVATRMSLLVRDKTMEVTFDDVNIEDPTAKDAEIILRMGNAMGLNRHWGNPTPEEQHAALMRCAENGLADYREWLYTKHGCYDMLPVDETNEGEKQ